ncbi:hypothetical protein [Streptomyces sp. NPDC058625]
MLGIVEVVVEGLFYLLVIGVIVFVTGFLLLGLRLGRGGNGKRRVR